MDVYVCMHGDLRSVHDLIGLWIKRRMLAGCMRSTRVWIILLMLTLRRIIGRQTNS